VLIDKAVRGDCFTEVIAWRSLSALEAGSASECERSFAGAAQSSSLNDGLTKPYRLSPTPLAEKIIFSMPEKNCCSWFPFF
jgi:hypothetical protein